MTSGIDSVLGRNSPTGQDQAIFLDAIQTNAAINPGNSGGALVDLQGQLIGIPTLRTIDPQFKVPANRVGFALPSNRAEFLAPQLIHAGKVKQSGRVEMGMQVTMLDPTIAAQYQLSIDRGVLVVNVVPNGPTAKAKLKPGDAIVQLGNKERRCPSHRWPAPGESQNPLRLENPLLRLV